MELFTKLNLSCESRNGFLRQQLQQMQLFGLLRPSFQAQLSLQVSRHGRWMPAIYACSEVRDALTSSRIYWSVWLLGLQMVWAPRQCGHPWPNCQKCSCPIEQSSQPGTACVSCQIASLIDRYWAQRKIRPICRRSTSFEATCSRPRARDHSRRRLVAPHDPWPWCSFRQLNVLSFEAKTADSTFTQGLLRRRAIDRFFCRECLFFHRCAIPSVHLAISHETWW